MTNKAYNLAITQLNTASKAPNSKGTAKITFRGKVMLRGREVERTVVAQGAAADKISGMVRKGASLNLRCLISEAPGQEEGKKGGQFLTVVDLPRAKAA